MGKIALGSSREATQPDCIRALVVEFIATFLFVFVGVASSMLTGMYSTIYIPQRNAIIIHTYLRYVCVSEKLGGDALVGLFVVAVAHALVVAVMISAAHISGGHLNPAVTIGLLAGGHITVFRSILYWIDQLVASAAASYLLYFLSGGQVMKLIKSLLFVYFYLLFFCFADNSGSYAGRWS